MMAEATLEFNTTQKIEMVLFDWLTPKSQVLLLVVNIYI